MYTETMPLKIWALVSVDTFMNARKLNPPTKNFKNVKFLIMPFYKLQSDDVATRRGMEKYFINKFSPALNET